MEERFRYSGIPIKIIFNGNKVKRILLNSHQKTQEITYEQLQKYEPECSGFSEFEKKVFGRVREIPFGRVSTYREIAKAIDSNAVRAVGNVMAKNCFLILVPCHRVVKSDLSIGNFSCGKNLKRKLLESEGIKFEGEKIRREYLFNFYRS